MKIKNWFIFLGLFLWMSTIDAQDSKADSIDLLINSIYTVEGFKDRLETNLDFNETFKQNEGEAFFIQSLVEIVRETALANHVRAVNSMIVDNFSGQEIERLIRVLNGSDGDLIRKLFELDNTVVEYRIKDYIKELVEEGQQLLLKRDSVLFEKEYPLSLSKYLNGQFVYVYAGTDFPVTIERQGDKHMERFDGKEVMYSSEWINNSTYLIILKDTKDFVFSPDSITSNVYSVDGKEVSIISKEPYSGQLYKTVLVRTEPFRYEDEITLYQAQLNDDYYNPYETPLKGEELENFIERGGHSFYPIDSSFRLEVAVERYEAIEVESFLTSSGDSTQYYRYAKLSFELGGKQQQLLAYTQDDWSAAEVSLFIPFTDSTSGTETYGGGRYLNVDYESGHPAFYLDFNKAYYPYCRYTNGYSCPIPPLENRLEVAITAGIKR